MPSGLLRLDASGLEQREIAVPECPIGQTNALCVHARTALFAMTDDLRVDASYSLASGPRTAD